VTWVSFTHFFVYVYNNLENIRMVLTGSGIGVLFKFIGIDNSDSSLYGRYIHVASASRLSFRNLFFLKIENIARVFEGVIGRLYTI